MSVENNDARIEIVEIVFTACTHSRFEVFGARGGEEGWVGGRGAGCGLLAVIV